MDIFKGASKTLKNVVKIVCEVEFISHYENQPLFGDVCSYLSEHNLMFNKFLGLSGRALKPIMLNNNPNLPIEINGGFINIEQSLSALKIFDGVSQFSEVSISNLSESSLSLALFLCLSKFSG